MPTAAVLAVAAGVGILYLAGVGVDKGVKATIHEIRHVIRHHHKPQPVPIQGQKEKP